ncbi:hypothetical protein PVAP13_5NG186881 [Panicum virgatum]|uniref:Uncharacterized protein n=1 Tax=Panicum virgatum TaxID=38727 RepID=A0A8T0RUA7_PANVG|nr:hypothetical protein PVAP13_5NG186881 [Panicum virgatum]
MGVSLPLHLKVLKINVMWPPTGAICIPSMKLAEHNMQLSIVLFTLTCNPDCPVFFFLYDHKKSESVIIKV